MHFLNFYSEDFSIQLYRLFSRQGIFDQRVILDITSCPASVMIPLSEVFLSHQKHTLHFAYLIPERYDINLIQSIGEEEVESATVKIYGELTKDKTTLAMVAGFEDKKPKLIAEHVNPEDGYLFNNIFDNDLTQSALAKTTMKLHKEILKLDNYKQFHLPRFDVNRMLNTFELISHTKSDHNIVMACFGSKIQRLATMLFVSNQRNRAIVDIIPNK